ncbi:hypothetical protein ES703_71327 [subsurface metagenome]
MRPEVLYISCQVGCLALSDGTHIAGGIAQSCLDGGDIEYSKDSASLYLGAEAGLEGNFAVRVIEVYGPFILILGIATHNEDSLPRDEIIPVDEIGIHQGDAKAIYNFAIFGGNARVGGECSN